MSKKKLTERNEAEIVDLYKNKSWYTIARLAKKFNVSSYLINKTLEKHNVPKRKINSGSSNFTQFSLALHLLGDKKKINGRELSIATEMLQKCSDGDFWQYIKTPFFRSFDDGKMPSLAWLKTEGGKNFLRFQWRKFKQEKEKKKNKQDAIETTWEPQKPKEYKLKDKPLIEADPSRKLKSFQEFLKENNHG